MSWCNGLYVTNMLNEMEIKYKKKKEKEKGTMTTTWEKSTAFLSGIKRMYLNHSCEYCFGVCSGLSTRMKYFGTGQFRHFVSGLSLISIY